jgi:CRP-like cAMP-binding protein
MANMPVSVFDFRTFPPNSPIVNEGEFEDSVYFVKSGSLRILKLVKFRVAKIPGGQTDLVPLPENEQVFCYRNFKKNSEDEDKAITCKLLHVKTIGPGEFFGGIGDG